MGAYQRQGRADVLYKARPCQRNDPVLGKA